MFNFRPHRNLGRRTNHTLRSGYYCSSILSDQPATHMLKRIKLYDDLYAQSRARCRFNNRPATALDGRRVYKPHRRRETKVRMALGLPQVWKVRINVGWYHPSMRRLPLRSSTLYILPNISRAKTTFGGHYFTRTSSQCLGIFTTQAHEVGHVYKFGCQPNF
jgi:hypothetical protein